MAAPRPGDGLDAGRAEPGLDELREAIGGNLLQPHDRAGLVEGPALAQHAFHQRRLRSGEDVADLALLLDRGAQRVLDAAAVERADAPGTRRARSPCGGGAPRRSGRAARRPRCARCETSRSVRTEGNETAIWLRPRSSGSSRTSGLTPDSMSRSHAARPVEPRFGGRERAGVALEERDVGAVAADRTSTVSAPAARGARSACRTSEDLP